MFTNSTFKLRRTTLYKQHYRADNYI